MKVEKIMSGAVATCTPADTLDRAAHQLWESDCGSLPVVDSTGELQAMITDRDICMAAYTTGRRLSEIHVQDCMTSDPVSCRPEDDIARAAETMAEHQVRRLPVVDRTGKVRGLLSVNDLVRSDAKSAAGADALRVLEAVSMPRGAAAASELPVTALQPVRSRGRKGSTAASRK